MPALLLLGQAVGVLAGQCPDEPRLAVVDVAGGADRQRHARTAAATSSISSSPSVRQSSSSLPSRTIPITGVLVQPQRRREALLDRAGEGRELGQRQRAAADARDRLLDRAADERRRGARRARARLPASSFSMRSTGTSRERSRRVEVEQERPFERGEPELVDPQRAVQRMAPQAVDEVGATDDDPGLRTAEQLVAAEADEVGAVGERAARGRLVADVDEDAGAEVVEQRQAARSARRRRAPSATGARRSRRRGSSTGARAGAALRPPSRRAS